MTHRLPPLAALDAVLVDAGGVLVDPDWGRIAHVLALHGVIVDADALRQAEPAAKYRMDVRETISETTDDDRSRSYFAQVLEGAGFDPAIPRAALESLRAEHAERNLWRVVLPGVPQALARLRAAGLRLAVVSNANGTVATLFKDMGLDGYFDALLDSYVEKVEKPDPRLFLRAVSLVGSTPPRSIHIGDLYEVDVVGARRAGIFGALVDVGGLYGQFDCPKYPSLGAFVDALLGKGPP
jgi:HAD superfamily hydrolase (TIGR01509 family)